MGASSSSSVSQSYLRYENDFELVIRATKDLERLLEMHFDAPSGKTVGLHDKISFAEERFGLSSSTVRTMRRLVTSKCTRPCESDDDCSLLIRWATILRSQQSPVTDKRNLSTSHLTASAPYLAPVRNQIVHNPEYNNLEDRVSFAVSFDNVEQELKRIVLARNPKKATTNDGSSCILM